MSNKLSDLEEDFEPLIHKILNEVEKETKRKWGVVFTRRTMAEQRKLYAQGRTTKGEIVTKAKPGYSAHNYGLAVDLCPLLESLKDFDWNCDEEKFFKPLADIAHKYGLTAGYYWTQKHDGIHDPPHIEHPRWRAQRALWLEGKIKIV
jgi:peptidoglycan LD-endopeptidase CwlK